MLKKSTTDILSLFSTSLIGQFIHVLILPFLSIYFSQAEIGAFFLFQALVAIGIIFVTMQSERAIVVESNKNSYLYFKYSVLIVVILSVLAYFIINPFVKFFPAFSHKTTLLLWVGYLPFALLIAGINSSIEYLFTFEKRFKIISASRIIRPALIYLCIFTFYFAGISASNTLIIGFIAGNGFLLLVQLFFILPNKLCRFHKSDFTLLNFKAYIIKHQKILVFNTISTGIVTASMQIPYLFIAAFYGESFSAWYGMALRIIGMPLSLLGQSAGQVFFQKFSVLHFNKISLYPVVKKLMVKLYTFGAGPIILLMVFVPYLFTLFLGPEWENAAQLSRILLPWLFLIMVSAPISNVVAVLGIQLKTIYYDISLFFVRIAGLYICASNTVDFLTTMIVFSVIGVVFNIFYQFLILHLSKNYRE